MRRRPPGVRERSTLSFAVEFQCMRRPDGARVDAPDIVGKDWRDRHGRDRAFWDGPWLVLAEFDGSDGSVHPYGDPRFGEDIAVGGASHGGFFGYARAVGGQLKRHLEYFQEGGWTVVEGEPE